MKKESQDKKEKSIPPPPDELTKKIVNDEADESVEKKIEEESEEIAEVLPVSEEVKAAVLDPALVLTEPKASQKDRKETEAAIAEAAHEEGMIEQVVSIKRITKVTKGGKKLSFSALVVVGNGNGRVGYSLEKASEVATAIKKAMSVAKKSMVRVPLAGTTIPHEVIGRCSGSRVLLKPASQGTGVIAAGPVRAVCDGAGIHNILSKCHRSNNPINVVKATMEGLARLKTNSIKES